MAALDIYFETENLRVKSEVFSWLLQARRLLGDEEGDVESYERLRAYILTKLGPMVRFLCF